MKSRAWPRAVLVLGFGPAAILALSLFASWWWIGELAVHWLGHALVLTMIAAALVARAHPRWAGGLMMLAVLAGLAGWPAATRPRLPTEGSGASLRVAHGNLYLYNDRAIRPAAVAQVLAEDPDIATLVEAIASEDRAACDLRRWPHQLWQPQPGRKWRDSIVLLSKFPILSHQAHDADGQPYLSATLDVHGQHLHVLVVHTESPGTAQQSEDRIAQLQRIAATAQALVAADPAPLIALGDFNCTPRSPAWDPLTKAGLWGPVAQPATWERHLGPLGIAIDHLLGRDLAMRPPTAFAIPGSDHRGLRTTIWLGK